MARGLGQAFTIKNPGNQGEYKSADDKPGRQMGGRRM
jgi:hypothetical protein